VISDRAVAAEGPTGWVEVNRANWDERAPAHAASPDYDVNRFVADPAFISKVVRFDVPLLGSVEGCRGVHLQCHIGIDTLSLARLGAEMTGLDLSPASLTEARSLAERAGPAVSYVEAEVYDALDVLDAGTFDLVYTGIGALCWLPDIGRWAQVVAGLLAPGGRLFIREGHPMLWSLDETQTDRPVVGWPYFEQPEPYVELDGGTYVTTDTTFATTTAYSWNHGLGEIVTALLDAGMELTGLTEHDSVPWEALPGQMVLDAEAGEWRLAEHPERLAASYTLQARRRPRATPPATPA
jgi:SAM-dependent methyltransferase